MGAKPEFFIIFARKDQALLQELKEHLAPLEIEDRITLWDETQVIPGTDWGEAIKHHLESASIILLLVSASFMASRDTYALATQALAKHVLPKGYVIPILLHPVDWEHSAFANLAPLPANKKPISMWQSQPAAYLDVVTGIRNILAAYERSQTQQGSSQSIPTTPNGQNKEAKMPDPAKDQQISSNAPTHVDILLVTVAEIEAKSVLSLFPNAKLFHREGQIYHDLGIVEHARIAMVQSEMGAGGQAGALLTIQRAITTLHPTFVIMVGMAFGTSEKKQHIGDILVSKQIMSYDPQRVGTDNGRPLIIPRGDRTSASPTLLSVFRAALKYWREPTKVEFGLILSGAKLADNQDFVNQLLKFEPEAIGGEMEGDGLYSAAQSNNVKWIMVKAICDWGDGDKGFNKSERQEIAAGNAARFTKFVLEQGGFVDPTDLGAQPTVAHKQSPASTSSPSTTLTLTLKLELVNLLLACSCMSNRDSRETVLRLLNDQFLGIASRVSRRADNQADVMEIIKTCENHPGSLQALRDIVVYFEGEDSTNTRNLKSFMQQHGL